MKSGTKNLIIAIVVGVVITLVTGLLDHTPSGLMGASWYGYPLAWLVQMVVAPQYFPWVVRPLRLIADLVFWIVIVWIILFAIAKVKKK